MDKETILELSGVVFELREIGDLESDIAILPDGRFEVISEHPLTWVPSLAYKSIYGFGEDLGKEITNYIQEKILKFLPILDRISLRVSKISLPEESEIKIIPILNLLG